MKKILFISIILTLLSTFGLYATLVLDPSGAGGFELGSSFADNGWTAVNSATTEWTFGTAHFTAGSNGAYITEGGLYTYSAVSQKVHLYHSVTIPEGETMATVSFKWKNTGEGPSSDYDNLKVFLAPSTYTIPAAGTEINSTYRIGANWYNQQADWQQASILLNPLTAGTYYLIFTWKTDVSGSYPPPAAIDEVSIVTSTPPSPLTGIKTIGTGGDYTTFTGAINDLNVAGVGAGGVTFNVSAGSVFIEDLPLITATGTSANPIIFQKSGAGANPEIQPTTGTQGIRIVGGDYITFDGIDIRVASGQIPNWGYYITNASATNGALYNTIKNAKITLNKANTSTKGIYDYYNVTPTNQTGINSYNTYQNLTIENSTQGIYVYGHSSYYSIGNVITNCTIGANTADDMGGGSTGYGIYAYYQDGLQISNNVIRNFTCSSSSVYGVYLYTAKNTNNIYSNRVYNLQNASSTSTSAVYGMYMTLGTSGTNVANVYNNMIWNLVSSYTGSGSTTYLSQGIYLGGATAANTYNVDYNSVRVVGPATSNSAGIYFAANTAVNKLRNNVIVNNTPNQTGSYYHTCVYFNHASTIGAATSVANNNVLYLANANNGLVVRGTSTGYYSNIQAWTAASSQDANSRPTDPQIDAANPLNILTTVPTPVESKAMFLAGITTDIYGTTRNTTTPDIGAHEGNFELESFCEAPTAQPTNLVLIPNPTTIAGSFTAAAANAYLVVGHASSTLTFSPVDGTYYSAGQIFNTTEVIISASAATSFIASGLTPATPYYCTIFAFNNTGIGAPKYYLVGPLTGTQTTLPAAPAVPGTLTATVISPSQIDLVFTANPAGDNIMIARNTVNTFGTPLATGYAENDPIAGGGTVIYMGPAGTFNDNALASGTLYYYSAWSYITAERTLYYAFSTTTKTANATTPQVPAILPFAETFEVWPNGWSVVNGTQANKWYVGNPTVFQGAQAAYISGDGGVTNQYVHTTSVSHMYRDIAFTAGAAEYEFSFRYNCVGESTYDGFKVFLTDLTTTPVDGTQLTVNQIGNTWYNLSSGWVLAKVNLPGTLAGTTKRLVISWQNDSGSGVQAPVAVDNVTLTAFMTPQPTALTASAITANSALLSWTSAAISFDLEWGTLGFTQGSGTMLSSITNNYTLGSLSAQTGYSYYVRANDGVNPSAWAGPYDFYTAFSIPIAENLDAVTTPNLPNGWSKAITSTATYCTVTTSTTAPNSSPNHVYMYHSSSNAGADVRLVSPPFANSVNTLYTRFFAKATALGKVLQVGTVNSQSVDAVFNLVSSIPLTTTYTPYIVDFAAAGAGQYIAYRIDTAAATYSTIYLDDININTSPYNELALTSFTVTPLYKFTAAEVTFSMTVKNNGTNSAGKNVVLKQGETELTTIPVGNLALGETVNLTYVWTPTTAGTFSFTAELPSDIDDTNNNASLTNQTIYTSGQLAEGFEGLTWLPTRWQQWQGTGENAWAQTTASNYDGTKAAGVVLTTTNSSSYLATPKLIFTASDNIVSFYARSTGTNQKVQCWYGESTDGTSYTAIGEPIAITGTYTQYTISAPELAGLNKRIAFQADPSGNAGTIYIDNIVGPIIYIPAETPGPVALVLPTNNEPAFDPETGSLSWTPPSSGGDAVGYYVRLSQNPDAFDEESNDSFDGTVYDVAATAEPTQTFLVYTEQLLSYNNDWYWQVIPYDGEFQTPRAGDCEHRMFHTIDQITAPGTLALGNIWANASRTGSIIVTNVGPTPLSFTVTGSPEFVFAAPPYSVPANDTYELGYTFTAPATLGAYSQVITITHTGYSSKNITATATVQENPTIVSFPFVEGFETGNTNASTTIKNWTQQVGPSYTSYNWTANNIATSYNRTPRTGAWNAYLHYSGQAYLFRPIQLVGGTAYSLEFYARQDGDTAANSWVKADLGTEATIAGMTTSIVPQTGIINGDYQRFYGTFTPATSGIYYVGIQGWLNSSPWYISLDDIKIDEVPLTPTFTLTPDVEEWNFGAVQKDLTATKQFTITNTGGGTLTINSVATTGQYYSISVEPNDLTLDMNQSTTFTVQYAPTAVTAGETQHQGLLTITHSEAGRTAVEIDLTGTCYDPTITVFPHTQNFGSTDAAFPPQYWKKHSGVLANPTVLGAENTGSWISDDWKNVALTPPDYAARINLYSTWNGWLISPPIAVPADDYELMFDVALLDYGTSNAPDLNGSDDIFAVLIGDGTSWAPANVARQWDNTVGATYVLNEIPHTGMTVNLPLGTAGTKYVAFYGISTEDNADNDLMVDNVVFRHIPATPIFSLNPNETEYSFGNAVLDVPVTRQYTITNTGPGILTIDSIVATPGSDFSISVGPTDTALTNMESTTFTVQFLPSAAGLREGTITINHGVSESRRATHVIEMSGTGVDTTIYPPFTEYFDSVTAPALPLGWTKQVYSDYPGSYNVTNSTTGPYSTPNNIRFYSYYTNDDLILISPKVDGEISDIRVKFWARYSSTATSMIVGTMDGIGTRAVFTPYLTVPITSTTNSRYAVDFADYVGTDRYVAFKLQVGATNAYRYIYLDNVTFEEPQSVPPLAATPTFPPNAAVTLKNPLLKWTLSDAGEPVEYSKVFMNTTGVFNLDLDTDVVYNGTATQFQTVTPDDATQYFWKVVNYNIHGRTAGPTWSFTTPGQYDLAEGFEGSFPPAGWLRTTTSTSYWDRSTTSPYEAAAGMYAYSSTSVVYTISTPKVTVDAASTLDFYAKVTDASQVLQILQSTDRQNWTQVGTNITLAGIDTWYPISVNLGLPTGDYYLAFSSPMQTIGSKYIYIDHVIGPEISPVLPDAVTQNTPAVDAVDQFNLPTFSWTAAATGGIPDSYKIYVGLSNTFTEADLKATVTSSPYRLTSPLAYATPYYWQVVAHNRAGDSINNGVRSFTTMANPTINVLPMEVDFTTFPPAAWYRGTGLLANPNSPTYSTTYWIQDDWLNITSPVNKAAKMNIYGANRSGWLITPPINIPSIGHRLELDIGLTDWSATTIAETPTDDRFIILIGDGSTWAPANILREWNNTGSPYVYDTIPNTGTHVTIPLDSYTGVYQIAFYGESIASGGDNDFFVDNVKVWLPPANDLAATQISGPFQGAVNTQFSYQVTVANMGTAAQNAYTVELHSVDTRALLTSINVTDALAPTETAVHTLNWTPTTVADYNIYAKVVLTGDADTTNNQTANKAVGVYAPLTMPFNETWDAFAGNHWTNTADGHWSVVSSGGNPGAAMEFSYSPTVTDYTSAFNSFVIDASAATGVRFKYDYYLSNHATTTIEGMRVEVYNGTAWTEIDNVTNQGGSIPWTTKTWDISSLVAGQMFKVRFITYGANSYNINYWYFDNIRFDVIPALLPQPTDLVVTQTGTNVNLNWTGTSTEGYKVYQSDDPYTWTGEGTLVATNTYSIPVGANPKKFFKVTGYFNSGAVPAPPTKQYRYNGSELIEPARAALFGEIERRK